MVYTWILYSVLYFVALNRALCEEVACDNSPCRCQLSNNSVIDISSVGSRDYPTFTLVSSTNFSDKAQRLVSYNPCLPFTETVTYANVAHGEAPCNSVAGCVLKSANGSEGSKPVMYALGVQDTASFIKREGDTSYSIVYRMPNPLSNFTVRLECDESEEHHTLKVDEDPDHLNNILMTLKGKCACLDKCDSALPPHYDGKPGLSTGSILLIVFFTLVLAYVVFGIMYNFCNGVKGAEVCPHVAFWRELPQLITDGCFYTCTCFTARKQSGYADV